VKIGRETVCDLIPHGGLMCLLDEVESWDETHILCLAHSHRSLDNPLRDERGLAAIHGVEYGAQAMAVHGALLARRDGRRLGAGYLAALREVQLRARRLDTVSGALRVSAHRLLADGGNLMYQIKVADAASSLLEARVTVVDLSHKTPLGACADKRADECVLDLSVRRG